MIYKKSTTFKKIYQLGVKETETPHINKRIVEPHFHQRNSRLRILSNEYTLLFTEREETFRTESKAQRAEPVITVNNF